jgi:hypothetical protein
MASLPQIFDFETPSARVVAVVKNESDTPLLS